MSSLYAVPMQFVGVACETLFVLDSKMLGGAPSKTRKNDIVLEDVASALFGVSILDDMFAEAKPLTLNQLRTFMQDALTAPSLKIESSSFEKVFLSACMSVKAFLIRVDAAQELVLVLDEKIELVQGLFTNPHIKNEIGRIRSAMKVFYGSVSAGGLSRIRCTQLNVLRTLTFPIGTLVNEGVQLETGHIIPRKSGGNSGNLGRCKKFDSDGPALVQERIPLADMNPNSHTLKSVQGENFFEHSREQQMSRLCVSHAFRDGYESDCGSQLSVLDSFGILNSVETP
eukprot:Plantae.Rhodophyta-Palmaria_palmata.ctg2006.p1 GENE.Plantae.Rhodophyta-Palmaria_palmata.ctg2006~~Plantae.Rhodophyta-Palmaria_palmata.ctg2006.p1  ORF type:complete len:335 (+),score=48.73 Plantae.Rhodophyta-Palmaria_palmata.ctg2006:152-1006(+)